MASTDTAYCVAKRHSMISSYLQQNWLAVTALGLGLINLGHTIYVARRDNEKLVTRSHLIKPYMRDGRKHSRGLIVKAANKGRRPIILTSLSAVYDDGSEMGLALNNPDGLTLNEKQHYSDTLDDMSWVIQNTDEDGVRSAENLFFEDTLGTKHYVKNAKKNLAAYWKLNNL